MSSSIPHACDQTGGGEGGTQTYRTKLRRGETGDDDEDDVTIGELEPPMHLPSPPVVQRSPTQLVFFSQSGPSKEAFVRPTYLFVQNILGVEAFLDERKDGAQVIDAMLYEHAHRCTHAVVCICPRYRSRPYCVKELNTFMERWLCGDPKRSIQILPILYNGKTDLNDYSRLVKSHRWLQKIQDSSIVDFMLKIVWPNLIEMLGQPSRTEAELRRNLFDCIETLREKYTIPWTLDAFSRDFSNSKRRRIDPLSMMTTTTGDGIRRGLKSYYKTNSYFTQIPCLFTEDFKHIGDLACAPLHRLVPSDRPGQDVRRTLMDQAALVSIFTSADEDNSLSTAVAPMILVIGNPGTGKTTLSKQLAYRWAQGAWGDNFDLVYVIPVRNLQPESYDGSTYYKEATLSTAIVNNCLSRPQEENSYKVTRSQVSATLSTPSTLVILDGLDERSGTPTQACESIINQASTGYGHALLMLSRAYNIKRERGLAKHHIEISGLSDPQVRSYVAENLDDVQSSSLLDKLAQYPQISEISRVPVTLEILCTLWGSGSNGERINMALDQGSLPGLYREVATYIWERYVEDKLNAMNSYTTRVTRLDISTDDYEALFDLLGEIAWKSLTEDRPIDVALVQHTTRGSFSGYLKVFQDSGFLLLKYLLGSKQYEFPHLTFQEYFAGRWLGRQLFSSDEDSREESREFFQSGENKYKESYGNMFTFLAGEVVHSQRRPKARRERVLELLDLVNAHTTTTVQQSLPHLSLQLRLLNEWLCLTKGSKICEGTKDWNFFFPISKKIEHQFQEEVEKKIMIYKNSDHIPRLTALLRQFRSVAQHTAPRLLSILLDVCLRATNVSNKSADDKNLVAVISSMLTSLSLLARKECLCRLRSATTLQSDLVRTIATSALADLSENAEPLNPFGAEEWRKYFGVSVGEQPSLPNDLAYCLEVPCPFRPGKTVGETHMLFLVPATVNGSPFSLDRLGELVKERFPGNETGTGFRVYWEDLQSSLGCQTHPESPCWILMTRSILPGTRGTTYVSGERTETLSAYADFGYCVPRALEAATGILAHYAQTGDRLFGDNPFCYTFCREPVEVNGVARPIVVGGFTAGGLVVDVAHYDFRNVYCGDGFAGCRRLVPV